MVSWMIKGGTRGDAPLISGKKRRNHRSKKSGSATKQNRPRHPPTPHIEHLSHPWPKMEYSITFVSQLADVSIDRLLHHGKARWLNCPDDVYRSGTLKKYPVSPRIGKKMTPGTMHLFGKNNWQHVKKENPCCPSCIVLWISETKHDALTDIHYKRTYKWTKAFNKL